MTDSFSLGEFGKPFAHKNPHPFPLPENRIFSNKYIEPSSTFQPLLQRRIKGMAIFCDSQRCELGKTEETDCGSFGMDPKKKKLHLVTTAPAGTPVVRTAARPRRLAPRQASRCPVHPFRQPRNTMWPEFAVRFLEYRPSALP